VGCLRIWVQEVFLGVGTKRNEIKKVKINNTCSKTEILCIYACNILREKLHAYNIDRKLNIRSVGAYAYDLINQVNNQINKYCCREGISFLKSFEFKQKLFFCEKANVIFVSVIRATIKEGGKCEEW